MRASHSCRLLGHLAAGAILAGVLAGVGCAGETAREPATPRATGQPWIVVGIDGGEWKIIRELWEDGRLPTFRRLAEIGVTAELGTKYTASPIIWTTIATGVVPDAHGITGFTVPTDDGDVPISSGLRRAPALWNMLPHARRTVAVLGWWATWPAEEIPGGRVMSDRATLVTDRPASPASFAERVRAAQERAEAGVNPFDAKNLAVKDRVVDLLARDLAAEVAAGDLDLLLAYFRGVDIASHGHFKHFRPEAFPDNPPDPQEIDRFAEAIPTEYEAVDQALAALLEAAPDANLMVISDHGFHAAKPEVVRVLLSLDEVFERLGYRDPDDLENSRVYTFASEDFRRARGVRFGDGVPEAERPTLRAALERDLARVTYSNGKPAFRVRDARKRDQTLGPVDFVVIVRQLPATDTLLLDGDPAPMAGVIRELSRLSGTHGENTDGIFLAAGPDVDPATDLTGIRIHDITPTLLYGLGLPVAEDFAGRAWTEMFSEDFRSRRELRKIATWQPALRQAGDEVARSAEDEKLLEELGALGYID